MDGFLGQVAADLYARYGDEVSSLHLVFPSRRSSLFFGEALSELISRPLWQPAAITIDEVAGELSGLAVGDKLRLVTELFKIYSEFHPEEDFDSFYFWGELLLGDFDSIDKYMVDADALFSNLVDLHELDFRFDTLEPEQRAAVEQFWGSFSLHSTSPEQRDFLTVWRTLGPVYNRFRARLRELGVAYQGMVYREAAERVAHDRAPQIPDRHYVIAGFNALSRCEQAIFDHLRRNFETDFYWDYDDYFVNDVTQEAGMFMRDNLSRFPPAATLRGGHDNFRKPKTIRSVAAASDVLQCKYAGLALADIARQKAAGTETAPPGRETAIVLCDESLLVPLLWSIPPEVEGINVTMGYPLRMHPSYTFVERLIELQSRRRSDSRERNAGCENRGRVLFYHSDVEGLVRHPCLAEPSSPTPPRDDCNRRPESAAGPHVGTGTGTIEGGNFVYINAARLRTSPLFEKVFAAPEGWRQMSDYLIDVVAQVGRRMTEYTEFFALIVEHLHRLAGSLEGCGIEPSTKTYIRLLRRSLQSVTVPFEGEPLEGVQIMGILETRTLDFENIIFLSAGDATMPGSLVGAPSFIPYNLKAAYGLPTPEHHEGVYAYHFFRLISRAHRIDAVWPRTADDRTPGAPSRYILQLDYEDTHHTVEKHTVTVDVNLSPVEPITVEKSAEIMARLEEFLRTDDTRRRLSPSLFFTFAECPLKFYFRGVARLRAEDEVDEEVDGALFGNILHRAMQLLYAPFVESPDPQKQIRALIGSAEVQRAVTTAVTELYHGEDGSGPEDWGGSVILAHKTVADYINRGILPYDAGLPAGFTVDGLEKRIESHVEFGSGTVLFSGIADRIDRLPGGRLRVVDYKTGNPKNNASALLQMGLYAMMLRSRNADVEPVLYYVRDMSKPGYAPLPVARGDEFEENLRAMLAELFDPATPFVQTADAKQCEWCDFNAICRR